MGVFAYYDPDTDATVYHVIPSPESDSSLSSFQSEVESTTSGTTIQSDELPGYFVLHHGRQQPASDNAAKWFPSDNIRRHVLRYLVSKALLGGHYAGPVKNMLAPVNGRVRRALDIGTRAGTWIQGMAAEFPDVQFCSLDIVPMMPHIPRRNIDFQVYDFTKGIRLDDESQDVVFLNIVLEMVKDYRALLREAHRVLRPGGLIYIHDFNPHLWDPINIGVPARETNPRGCQLFDLVRSQVSRIGIDPDTCERIPQWLASGSDFWDEGHTGFENIQSTIRTFPPYPHDGHACADRLGTNISSYLRHMTVVSMQDMSGLLKDTGMPEEKVHELITDMIEELKQHEKCVVFKVYTIHAIKL